MAITDAAAQRDLPPRRRIAWGAPVNALAFDRAGKRLGIALGDGRVPVLPTDITAGEPSAAPAAHRGAVLSLVVDPHGEGFVSGGDDGRLIRHGADGRVEEIDSFAGAWLERLACHTASATLAAGVGRSIILYTRAGDRRVLGPHPSTVSDIDFSRSGSRLAAAHYGGATLHALDSIEATVRKLEWKGSHIVVRFAPDGKFVATSTQDQALHVWRLADGRDMQMQGYPAKIKQIAWSANARMLYTSASSGFTAWSFAGKGPEGRPPIEFGDGGAGLQTAVATHPDEAFVLGGFEIGEVQLGDGRTRRAAVIRLADGEAISCLAWSPNGFHAAIGTEAGTVELLSLRR